ncbi:MAG: RNA polymerase sigma factor [Clostridia bacterium]|nr:RNA polymerase sigma factor [Clostridia bacterium]
MLICCLTSVATGTESPSPDTLLTRIADGDREALGTLYEEFHKAIYGYAFSVVKNEADAEDVLHDCFVSIAKHAASYRRGTNAKAWMFTIAKNLAIQKWRDRQKSDMPDPAVWELLPDDADDHTDDRLTVEACMKYLSDEERQIIVLHVVSGFRHREIAALLNLPLSTVLSKYNRSLKKLQRILSEKEREP